MKAQRCGDEKPHGEHEYFDTPPILRNECPGVRPIGHTEEPQRMPWPKAAFVQGGARGMVMARDGGAYRTAFVEVFLEETFLRGEGETIAAAEEACWKQHQAIAACPTYPLHGPWERRHFRNGAGYCGSCGGWFPGRVTGLPELPEESAAEPSLLEKALTGQRLAAEEVLLTYLRSDDLPTREEFEERR